MKKCCAIFSLMLVVAITTYHIIRVELKKSASFSIAVRRSKIYHIAYASAAYANENNSEFPKKWSTLVPSYISEDEAHLFLRILKPPSSPPSISSNMIDNDSIHGITEWQDGRWIVYEKPNVWEDGRTVWGWVLFVDGKWTKGRIGIGDSKTFEKLMLEISSE